MTEQIDAYNLQPGQRYRVELHDCCIQGELAGEFREFVYDVEDGDPCGYRFDFGVLEPGWGHFTFRAEGES